MELINYFFYGLSCVGYVYSGIKIIKLIKNRKQEKHFAAKGIAYALFYEPFIIYDCIKYLKKRIEVKS